MQLARRDAPANVEIVEGDVWNSGLPNDNFDLVHMRFVASTSGDTDGLVSESLRLARPGGIVAMQEGEGSAFHRTRRGIGC